MQSFRQSRTQLSSMMREFNNERKQSLKSIKSFYSEIESKQVNIFDNALQRLQLNLQNFKDNKYKKMHGQIDNVGITKKYEGKLDKIDKEIDKLCSIIKNGCGKIVQRPITSRISINSNSGTQLGTESKRESEDQTPSRSDLLYLESQISELSLQNIEERINKKNF